MKQCHDGYHLGIGQRAVTVVLPFRLVPLGSESVNLDKSVIQKISVILSLAIVIAKVFVIVYLWNKFTKKFRYFPNNQLVIFHRTHVILSTFVR